MSSLSPRVVILTRQSEYDSLLAEHGTRGQVDFFLKTRGQTVADIESAHVKQIAAVETAKRMVPAEWSMAQLSRSDLDRFLFGPNDIVVAIGQDGLVANLAKYLNGQPVIGLSADPARTEGVLTASALPQLGDLFDSVVKNDANLKALTMVEASLDDGQKMIALNELFIGHRSHQSARYDLHAESKTEYQSSSGLIVSTGTGLTGWARSIMTTTNKFFDFTRTDPTAAYFAREPWPSNISGNSLRYGQIGAGSNLSMTSRMNDGGVIFADGIEQDYLRFEWGMTAKVSISAKTLNLVS